MPKVRKNGRGGVVASGMAIFASILSTARGALLAVGVLPFVAIFLCQSFGFKKRQSFLWVGGFFLLVAVAIGSQSVIPPPRQVQEKQKIVSQKTTWQHLALIWREARSGQGSVGQRINMWKSAYLMFEDVPYLGVGGGQGFFTQKEAYAQQGLISPDVVHFDQQHNEFLDHLSKRGLLGLSGILILFLTPLWLCWRERKKGGIAGLGAVLGFTLTLAIMVYGLTQCFFMRHNGIVFYFLCLMLFLSWMRKKGV